MPGWFMKTEYGRHSMAAFYPIVVPDVPPPRASGEAIDFKKWVQTISTSLVYRFNSGGRSLPSLSSIS